MVVVIVLVACIAIAIVASVAAATVPMTATEEHCDEQNHFLPKNNQKTKKKRQGRVGDSKQMKIGVDEDVIGRE